eukprot:CAMPEP_0182445692 /NCGR_PEP_ID=MMETSP1172-20130603/3730_1 /TAXON_ID=708627 /ORGANISM="Timspurckia oligopyrenoides, Strain CCMP3278" /LENGTH=260 /DNA_ID=CAMNT_0024641505 /DNA_START=202 /DNA_END=984 /DNA_ORIENTATION=+
MPRCYQSNYEITVLQNLDHPGILSLHEILEDDQFYYLISKYLEGPELFQAVLSIGGFQESHALIITEQILCTLEYLHHVANVAHRDIKLENFVFSNQNDIVHDLVMIDFGLARYFDASSELISSSFSGTVGFQPPEQVLKESYDPKEGDMWSLGVLLFAVVTRTLPFKRSTIQETKAAIIKTEITENHSGLRHISPSFRHLIIALLNKDPENRPSASEALNYVRIIQNRSSKTSSAVSPVTDDFEERVPRYVMRKEGIAY